MPTAHFEKEIGKARSDVVFGGKETGKTALIETIASNYDVILDLYGSRDNEGLGWLRSPLKKKVLFLKGKDVQIDCNCASVIDAKDFKVRLFDEYNMVLSAGAFYHGIKDEWRNLALLTDKLWYRTGEGQIVCLLIREASSLVASRHIIGEDQSTAMNMIIMLLREMRHCGFAVALDTIRWFGVDRDIRAVTDYTFIKALGTEGLPKDLRFLYRYFAPARMQQMKPDEFRVISREGAIGIGTFDLPTWHKREGENLLREFDIKIKYPESSPTELEEKSRQWVNDYEHVRIINMRIEQKLGMEKLGKEVGRSSRTIMQQIHQHNNYVSSVGTCPRCSRVQGAYATKIAET